MLWHSYPEVTEMPGGTPPSPLTCGGGFIPSNGQELMLTARRMWKQGTAISSSSLPPYFLDQRGSEVAKHLLGRRWRRKQRSLPFRNTHY